MHQEIKFLLAEGNDEYNDDANYRNYRTDEYDDERVEIKHKDHCYSMKLTKKHQNWNCSTEHVNSFQFITQESNLNNCFGKILEYQKN